MTLPPYQRCQKLPKQLAHHGEHVVQEGDVVYDGFEYAGWCKFCGQLVRAKDDSSPWLPVVTHYIPEGTEVEDLLGPSR